MMVKAQCVIGVLLAGCFVAEAPATLVFGSAPGLDGLGSFTGSVTFTATSATTGTLLYSLTNTSPSANGGYITAIAFNVVDGVSLSFVSGPSTWGLLSAVSASPYPSFDFGAGNGDWLGGGSPTSGIAVGQAATVAYSVTASAAVLAGLTDASFFDGSNGYAFAARFRGFANGGSDKVLGVVPGPAPLALGLLAIGAVRGRRR